MRQFISNCLMFAFIFLIGGCAQSYYAINPTKVAYTASNSMEDVSLYYRYDVLNEKGNSKISKKEKKNNIKLVAVKITNNTDKVINIGNNAAFYSGNTMIYPMESVWVNNNLKQSVPSHLFYLLFTPLTFTVNGSHPFPVGLILGPLLAGSNMLVAANANKNLFNELLQYDIVNRDIKVGETVYGLVGFRNLDYSPLTIKLTK
ncbi:MAG: hypothetical protein WCG93_01325 [Paludibacter sp.]